MFWPRGHGSIQELLEMATASLMQDTVQIRKKNTYLVTNFCFETSEKIVFGLSALRALTVGPWFGVRRFGCGVFGYCFLFFDLYVLFGLEEHNK